jgi:hypothetical protein
VYDGDWHHFVLVVEDDSNNSGHSDVTIWIDNSKVWDKADIPDQLEYSDVFSTTYMPSIGMERDGSYASDRLDGYLDEFKIFGAAATDDDVDNLYHKRFGVPVKFDTWTSSIEDYSNVGCPDNDGDGFPDPCHDLIGSHDNADGFLYNAYNAFQQKLNNFYYYQHLNLNSDFSHVAHDASALLSSWMKNSNQDDYDVVFLSQDQ